MTRVIVATKAIAFQPEVFLFVASNKKKAEAELKVLFPGLRWINREDGTYQSDKEGTWLIFLREEEVL